MIEHNIDGRTKLIEACCASIYYGMYMSTLKKYKDLRDTNLPK
jgi:hypothetical protein